MAFSELNGKSNISSDGVEEHVKRLQEDLEREEEKEKKDKTREEKEQSILGQWWLPSIALPCPASSLPVGCLSAWLGRFVAYHTYVDKYICNRPFIENTINHPQSPRGAS